MYTQLGVRLATAHAQAPGVAVAVAMTGEGRVGFQARTPAGAGAGDVVWLDCTQQHVYSKFIPGVVAGTCYTLWLERPGQVRQRIVDPYARALVRDIAGIPLGVVVDTTKLPRPARPLRTPWNQTIVYELHVRGFTRQLPSVPAQQRGTFEGLASPAACGYLHKLGVSAVELMPVTEMLDEVGLRQRGLTNYWGYNPIGCFAPAARHTASVEPGGQVHAFAHMVQQLHAHGIEVIIDLVLNHTGEHDLPPGSASIGALVPGFFHPRGTTAAGATGCGNTVNFDNPVALRWAMDCMRYWVETFGVDGFRLDLATTLGRVRGAFDREAPLFRCIYQDPALAGIKLIAEPWDVGHNGYQAGNFPPPWREWNDRFRDDVRRFWRGDGSAGTFATRMSGSSDRFAERGPLAAINYVAAHDGMTVADLGSYDRKHNLANGEDGRDGPGCDFSTGHGAEGPSDDPRVCALRRQHRRNLLASVLLAQGVPMLQAGDELGRTQQGNNNAYCHDSPLSWVDWGAADAELQQFVQALISLRKRTSLIRRERFLCGRAGEYRDVAWLSPGGDELTPTSWHGTTAFVMVLFVGTHAPGLAMYFNPTGQTVEFVDRLGLFAGEVEWLATGHVHHSQAGVRVGERSMAVCWPAGEVG